MNSCLDDSDLKEMGEAIVAGFDRRIAAIPSDLCAPFYTEARGLETELLALYRVIVTLARKLDDLDAISSLWKSMAAMCDTSLVCLQKLIDRHPLCGAESFYDRVLDLRNKCVRLQKMHS
jgi:hypothetical protein